MWKQPYWVQYFERTSSGTFKGKIPICEDILDFFKSILNKLLKEIGWNVSQREKDNQILAQTCLSWFAAVNTYTDVKNEFYYVHTLQVAQRMSESYKINYLSRGIHAWEKMLWKSTEL